VIGIPACPLRREKIEDIRGTTSSVSQWQISKSCGSVRRRIDHISKRGGPYLDPNALPNERFTDLKLSELWPAKYIRIGSWSSENLLWSAFAGPVKAFPEKLIAPVVI
jgi:hypothetical protein